MTCLGGIRSDRTTGYNEKSKYTTVTIVKFHP